MALPANSGGYQKVEVWRFEAAFEIKGGHAIPITVSDNEF